MPNDYSSAASFGGSLVSIGGITSGGDYSADFVALSPLNQVWVHVGKVPDALWAAGSIVLPTGDLVVIGGGIGRQRSAMVFKASLTGEDQLLSLQGQSHLFCTPILRCPVGIALLEMSLSTLCGCVLWGGFTVCIMMCMAAWKWWWDFNLCLE